MYLAPFRVSIKKASKPGLHVEKVLIPQHWQIDWTKNDFRSLYILAVPMFFVSF